MGKVKNSLQDIEVVYVSQTDRAWLVKPDEAADAVWVPKSQCQLEAEDGADPLPGDVVMLTAPSWILEEKGLV